MTKVPKKKNRLGTPPEAPAPNQENLRKSEGARRVQLNFDVSPEFKKEFKTFALDNELTMGELLILAFERYKS